MPYGASRMLAAALLVLVLVLVNMSVLCTQPYHTAALHVAAAAVARGHSGSTGTSKVLF